MGWVTLTLRKQTLKAQINEMEFQDIQMSRQLRSVERHLAYDQSVFNADKTADLREAKADYLALRDKRPKDISSKEYDKWKQDYADAQEDYQARKQDIEDYYSDLCQDLETEATDEEARISDEQTSLEAQLKALQAELETVDEQIKSDIDSQKISLS